MIAIFFYYSCLKILIEQLNFKYWITNIINTLQKKKFDNLFYISRHFLSFFFLYLVVRNLSYEIIDFAACGNNFYKTKAFNWEHPLDLFFFQSQIKLAKAQNKPNQKEEFVILLSLRLIVLLNFSYIIYFLAEIKYFGIKTWVF